MLSYISPNYRPPSLHLTCIMFFTIPVLILIPERTIFYVYLTLFTKKSLFVVSSLPFLTCITLSQPSLAPPSTTVLHHSAVLPPVIKSDPSSSASASHTTSSCHSKCTSSISISVSKSQYKDHVIVSRHPPSSSASANHSTWHVIVSRT